MDAAAELGRNPVSKHHIQPEYGDEQADSGRDCRTLLARSNSQTRTGNEEMFIFSAQLTTSKIGIVGYSIMFSGLVQQYSIMLQTYWQSF